MIIGTRHVSVTELVVVESKVGQEQESQLTATTICGMDVLGFGQCTADPPEWYRTCTEREVLPMRRVSRQVRPMHIVRRSLRGWAVCGGDIGGGGVENIYGPFLRQ